MFDAKRLLDQVMNSQQGRDLARMAGDMVSGSGGARPSSAGQSATRAQGGLGDSLRQATGGGGNDLLKGAIGGGLVGLLLGNRGGRKMLGKGAGTALKLGGIAAVGALAYTAYQRHKAGQGAAPAEIAPPPPESRFAAESSPAGAEGLARGILVAMIQGAKADGHVDADEQRRIFSHIETLTLEPEAKAFVMDELAAPADIARVTAHAAGPEVAAELYAASLLAMDPDQPEERAYLDRLAASLRIESGLQREIELTVASGV